jgi:C1A family cysteine protease
VALGYHPDLPDSRDHVIGTPSFAQTESSVALKAMAAGATVRAAKGDTLRLLGGKSALPKRVHLGDTGFMPVIEDQGEIGSCTANAVIGIAEYLIRAAGGRSLDLSRMFLYKVTRRLLGWTGDTGAYVRTTIQALRLFGVPPEADWPYDGELLDAEPDAYHYSYAQNFRGLCFARLDGYGDSPNGTSRGAATLTALKRTLADGFPVAFGFPVYESIQNMGSDFVIPLPQGDDDRIVGGHAVVAVGYDDSVKVPGQSGAGAVIVRNSWGVEWGDLGYGFLPFDYVRRELAVDWWTLFHTDFVELSHFY